MNEHVFMLGYSDTFVDGRSSGDLPPCEPVGWFDTPEDVIRYASKEFRTDGNVYPMIIEHDQCSCYRLYDVPLKRYVYVYVWTITKAVQS